MCSKDKIAQQMRNIIFYIFILQHLCTQASKQSSNVAQEYKWLCCDLYLYDAKLLLYGVFPFAFFLGADAKTAK